MAGVARDEARLDFGAERSCAFCAMPVSPDFRALQRVEARWAVTVPLMEAAAPCGFPSPADDYLDKPLDFNELLIANPSATFCVRVAGDSMIPVLFPEDIGVVDRSLTPVDKSIVLACLDGDFTIKRYRKRAGRVWLQPENPHYQPIYPNEDSQFEVWGVIWRAVRLF